jgi:pimeloyl-ACP methyl ester carboxylesterase
MINGGFLGGTGEANRDNNYILDHVDRLRDFPVHIVHGRYDTVCHLYQAEALERALRGAGNSQVHYFITTAGTAASSPKPIPDCAPSSVIYRPPMVHCSRRPPIDAAC